jgi:hypothetical protein
MMLIKYNRVIRYLIGCSVFGYGAHYLFAQEKGGAKIKTIKEHYGFFAEKGSKAVDCGCNNTIPAELRLPKIRSGKDWTIYDTNMDQYYGKQPEVFEALFKKHVADFNNISGSVIYFPSGKKDIYRSAMLAYSPDTLKELMEERGVKTVFHLSNKKTVDQQAWTQKEKEYFLSLGGKLENYVHIKDFDYLFNDEDELYSGQQKVAEIIEQIEKSEGNVVIHCLGGEHKTELIFEVMQKHYNHLKMDNITERYKCHTAWQPDPLAKSGFKQNNLDFIRDFPGELLEKKKESQSMK